MKYSPAPLSSKADASKTARDFGALFGHVLLATVAQHARVVLVPRWREPWRDTTWTLAALDYGNEPVAFELQDGTWLYVAQTLGIRESRRDGGKLWLTTLMYKYRWQATEDDASWIVRWEYVREAATPRYPVAHVHVNAVPDHYDETRKAFPRVHLPSGRIAIEDVVSFLIREQGVAPVSNRWGDELAEAREIFAQIQGRGGTR